MEFTWGGRLKSSMLWSHPLSSMPQGRGQEREEDTKRLETAQYRMAQYMLDVRPTDHVRMTAAYEMLGMIPL